MLYHQRARLFLITTATLLSAMLVCSGCGPSGPTKHLVSGKVTFDGQPVPDGDIVFIVHNAASAPVAGKIQAGTFRLEALAGKARVEIRASCETGKKTSLGPIRRDYIPPCYNSQSTLTAAVEADSPNELCFDLRSSGKPGK